MAHKVAFIPQLLIGTAIGTVAGAAFKIGFMTPHSNKMERVLSSGEPVDITSDAYTRKTWAPLTNLLLQTRTSNQSAAVLESGVAALDKSPADMQASTASIKLVSAICAYATDDDTDKKDALLAFGKDAAAYHALGDDAVDDVMAKYGVTKTEATRLQANSANPREYFGMDDLTMRIMRPVIEAAERDFQETNFFNLDSLQGLKYPERKRAEYAAFRPICKAVFDVPCTYPEFAALRAQSNQLEGGIQRGDASINITEKAFMKNL